jgi:flotillin
MNFENKTAVVTGGSRGIGLAIAKKLAEGGANIAILYVGDESEGINAKAEAMKKYGEAAILEMYFKALPDVVKNAAMPLTQVDKITMYGDGNSSKLVGDIIGSTTKITDGLTEATGIDLRALLAGFLGGKLADTGNTAAVAEAIAAAKKSVEDEYADGEDFSTDLEDF